MCDEIMTATDLLRSAESLSAFSELETFIANLSKSLEAGSIPKEEARAIRFFGFQSFLDATKDAPFEAEKAILKWIVPACLETDQREHDTEGHRMRELLATWVDQYADEQKVPLRTKVLTQIESRLDSDPSIPAVWTVGALGLRTPQLELHLEHLATRNNELGDAAIECLASLFPNADKKRKIIQQVVRRLQTRKVRSFFSAVSTITDARFIPSLARKLFGAENDDVLIIGLLGRIADNRPLDSQLQTRVWRVFRRAIGSNYEMVGNVLITGGGITLCNTAEVIPSLTRLLTARVGAPHLVFGRLKECVRPLQLEGWSRVDKHRLKSLLASAAMSVTGNSSLSMTVEDHSRRAAWETALVAGIRDVAPWLAAAMADRSGPFEKADALTYSSYYRLDSWPETAERLVVEGFELEERHGAPITDRTAAIQFFLAVGTFEALNIIVRAGLTGHGAPLRSNANAVAELAVWLAQSDPQGVVQQLLDICGSQTTGTQRTMAIVGLQSLADRHVIPSNAIPRLAGIAQDRSLPNYAIAAAIWTMACYPEAASLPDYVVFLIDQIRDARTDVNVRFQCFQSLVRLGIWKDHEQVFVEALDLTGSSTSLSVSNARVYQGWQAILLTRLALHAPDKFLDALIQVIRGAGFDAVQAALEICARANEPPPHMAEAVAQAAIARTLRLFNSFYAEADTLTFVARLAPHSFVDADWEQHWASWRPEGRSALARAIERNVLAFPTEVKWRLGDLLESLLSDSVYQVRRIAARAYSKIDIAALHDLCLYWSQTGNSGLRLRAAEIAQFLPPDDSSTMDNTVLRALRDDPEKRVRNAATEGIANLRNRLWANELFDLICSHRNLPPNDWVADCYRYGHALAHIGDDDILDRLGAFISDQPVAPNVANWLRSVERALDERWKYVMRNWPDPIFPWAGTLEEIKTHFSVEEHKMSAGLLLWCDRAIGPGGVIRWGGSFVEQPGFQSLRYFLESSKEPLSLKISGRSEARIWIASAGSHGLVSFVGNGPYPEALSAAELHRDE